LAYGTILANALFSELAHPLFWGQLLPFPRPQLNGLDEEFHALEPRIKGKLLEAVPEVRGHHSNNKSPRLRRDSHGYALKTDSSKTARRLFWAGMLLAAARHDHKMRAWVIKEADKAVTRDVDRKRLQPLLDELKAMGDQKTEPTAAGNGQG
jgi:hypothetical protein